MFLKKITFIFVAAILVSFALPSCSSSEPEPKKIEKKKLNFWQKTACVLRMRYKGCNGWIEGKAK